MCMEESLLLAELVNQNHNHMDIQWNPNQHRHSEDGGQPWYRKQAPLILTNVQNFLSFEQMLWNCENSCFVQVHWKYFFFNSFLLFTNQ